MSHVQSIRRTVAAANSGNVALAKTHLQKAAEAAPEDAAVWRWLGWFAESPVNAVQCLEMAIEDERYRDLANAGLAWARAMANFKVAEDAPVAVLPPTTTRSVAPVAQVEMAEHHVEELLAADIAQVAAEVAIAVAAPAFSQVASEADGFSAARRTVEDAQIAKVPVCVETTASRELLTTIAAPELDSWTGLPAAESSVSLKPATEPIADSTAAQPWATTIGSPETGLSRASLWGGLGLGAKRESQPNVADISPIALAAEEIAASVVRAPSSVVEAPNPSAAFTDDWSLHELETPVAPTTFVTATEPPSSSVIFLTAVASSVDAGVVQATVAAQDFAPNWSEPSVELAPPLEELAVAEPLETASEEPAPAAAPGLWRAMKSNWFSSGATAEPKLAVEPIAAELVNESTAPASRQTPVTQPESPVLAAPDSQTTPRPESLFAWQREPVESAPHPAPQATSEIDISPAVDVFEEDELTIEVPFAREASGNERVVDAPPAFAQPVKTILVVDDSPTVRKLVAMTLEKRGFKVVSAFDGVAAIKEIAAHNPALILMDINMPRLDGYQLCKLVKKHETTRNIPVVMLSGKDGMFDRLRGRLVGCSGYITKPFVPDVLVEAVEEYLAQAVKS